MRMTNTDRADGIGQKKLSPGAFGELAAQWFSVPVFFYDHRDDLLQYDPVRLAEELGYQASASFDFLHILHTDDRAVLQLLLAGKAGSIAVRLLHGDGSWRHYRLANQGSRDTAGRKVSTVVLEQVSGAFVPETLNRIRGLAERLLAYGTFEYDLTRNTGTWSEGLYELLGYGGERPVVNKDFYRAHIDSSDAEPPANAPGKTGQYSEEYTVITRQGLKKQVQVTGHKVCDEQGRVVTDSGLVRDLTRQKLHDVVIRKYIDELERSNQELEEFAYIASHDLQEPLRKISTFSSRLMARVTGQLDAESNEYIDRISTSVESMRLLIDSLLEFSRIARIHEVFLPVDLNMILKQTKQELELKIEETGTRILSRKLPVIEASASQMKQLFSNLIGNAIKFRKKDTLSLIRISSERVSDKEKEELHLIPEQVYHKIIFSDNGIGFEQEYATRIFQVFQRLHGKAEYPGSGIGLSICKRIADHHGGLISARNIQGQGASFEVILPERAVPPDVIPDMARSQPEPGYVTKPSTESSL